MDIYPTLVDLIEFEKPDHLDGKSLVPQLKKPQYFNISYNIKLSIFLDR